TGYFLPSHSPAGANVDVKSSSFRPNIFSILGLNFEPSIAQRLFVAHSLHFLILFYTIKKITKGVHK
ncbi:MAG: hypothetical protein WBG61_15275, partial [Desulfobacterales bacterium]